MIRALYFKKDGSLRTDLEPADFPQALIQPHGMLWVDFEATSPEQDMPILQDVFHFHPLAVDDALQESHVPKIDDWGEFLYIVLHGISFERTNGGHIETQELDVFLGNHFMVTHHDVPIPALESTWDIVQRDQRHLQEGADHMLYRLVDEVVAGYMSVVEELDEAIDQTEEAIFDHPSRDMVEHIFTLKRAALHLRRIIGHQREVLNKLARDDYTVIDARDRVYFRDIYDHLVRLTDLSESIRELVISTLDTYLSVTNNRLNEVMRTLTVITTLFMPITFLTGFFGMNFFQPEIDLSTWTEYPAFLVVFGMLIALPVVLYWWMRRRLDV